MGEQISSSAAPTAAACGLAPSETPHQPAKPRLNADRDPLKWSFVRKWVATTIVLSMTALIAFASSVYTAAIDDIVEHYGCSKTVSTLGVTTFLIGFVFGPLIFAPLSELWGRKLVYRLTLPLFLLSTVGCALASNISALLIFRLLCGFFGAPSVTNSGGSLTDVWAHSDRTVPLVGFSAASFLAPVIAPIVGGFVCDYTNWRWIFWITLILGGVIFIATLFFLPETYAPKLLEEQLASTPPMESYGTASTVQAEKFAVPDIKRESLARIYYTTLTRPCLMLVTEPILFLLSLYMALVYGILYLDFSAYPIVFKGLRHWSPSSAGLSFLGIVVGMTIACLLSPLINRFHAQMTVKHGPVPETRLPHLVFLSPLIPASLFWFAFTAESENPLVSISSGALFGAALVPLFTGITAYLIDCYGKYSASALAANAVLRGSFGAGFPLFAQRMYDGLGVRWATATLAFAAVVLCPLPWVFWRYGAALRGRSGFHLRTIKEEREEEED